MTMTRLYYDRGERLDSPIFCNAWLSPDGAMYFVDGTTNHDAASCIIMQCADGDCYACSDRMIADGWLILSKGRTNYIYGNAPLECLSDEITQAQRDTLFDVLRAVPAYLRNTRFTSSLERVLA